MRGGSRGCVSLTKRTLPSHSRSRCDAGEPNDCYATANIRYFENTRGNANNFVKTVVFDVALVGDLANNPFSQLALRAQSTTNPGGSIKTDLVPGDSPAPIPLPAGGVLLAGALGLIGLLRRRKLT